MCQKCENLNGAGIKNNEIRDQESEVEVFGYPDGVQTREMLFLWERSKVVISNAMYDLQIVYDRCLYYDTETIKTGSFGSMATHYFKRMGYVFMLRYDSFTLRLNKCILLYIAQKSCFNQSLGLLCSI